MPSRRTPARRAEAPETVTAWLQTAGGLKPQATVSGRDSGSPRLPVSKERERMDSGVVTTRVPK